DKAANGRVFVIDGFNEAKTKAASAALKAAGIEGRALIVLDPNEEASKTVDRAFRNLTNVAFSLYGSLATYDVLVADAIVFTNGAFESFTTRASDGGDAA